MPVFPAPSPSSRPSGSPNTGTLAPWATPEDVCEPCNNATINPDLLLRSLQAASDILFNLSGRQYAGVGQDTVRPCSRCVEVDHGRPVRSYQMWPGVYGWSGPDGWGSWDPSWGSCLCNRTETPGCGFSLSEIGLGVYPLVGIVQVLIDGVVVDPTTYRIDNNRTLVRLADPARNWANDGWPQCQRDDRPSSAPGTFEVTIEYGVAPPVAGVSAAAELGCQLALSQAPKTLSSCRLPQRVTNIVRNGLSAVVLDPMVFLDKGRTGLFLCDLFLTASNPHHLLRRATVSTPDIGRRVRRTTG